MTRTRQRKPRPTGGLLGSTSLAQWRENADRLGWATTDARFREAVTVVRNESQRVSAYIQLVPGLPLSEPRQLGWREGYDAALNVLALLAGALEPASAGSQDDQVTYPPPVADEAAVDDF